MLGVKRYAWADTAYDLAWTLAVVAGRTTEDVLAAYGVRAGSEPARLSFEVALLERNEHLDDYGLIQLKEHNGHLLAIEPNGWVGNAPEVARKLASPTGRFLSVYWSPSAHQLVQATDDQLVAWFDPTFLGQAAGASDLLPGWVEPDDFPLEHLRSASLAAVERVTGVAFDEAWLSEPLPTYRLPF